MIIDNAIREKGIPGIAVGSFAKDDDFGDDLDGEDGLFDEEDDGYAASTEAKAAEAIMAPAPKPKSSRCNARAKEPVSLETSIDEEEDSQLGDFIEDA